MASNIDAVTRVLSESRVSPPPGSVPTSSLPLTFFDIMWLFADDPVQRLFFYPFPHPTAYFLDAILPDLKASLSLALQHFYFLAGKLRPSPGSDDKYEIFYTDGDSISFTVAECDGDFQDLSQGRKNNFVMVLPLVPLLPVSPTSRSLYAVQVTVFPNSGICIGVTMHHVACDGSSSIHFIKTWASAFRSGGSTPLTQPPPLFDRAAIADPLGLYSIFITRIRGLFEGVSNPSPPSTQMGLANHADGVFAIFVLGPDHIQKLKKRALDSAEPFHCSAFAVACAHVWVCLNKTRAHNSVTTTTTTAHMGFAVDCRERLRPPVPTSYFGNCLGPCYVEVGVSSLMGEDGFQVAAKAIGRAIGRLGEKGALDDAEEWLEKGISLIPAKPLSVAGSPKLRVYDTDFGWGRPLRVAVPSISYSGALSIAENRGEQGGLEIGLVLHKDEMDEFEAHFFKVIEQST